MVTKDDAFGLFKEARRLNPITCTTNKTRRRKCALEQKEEGCVQIRCGVTRLCHPKEGKRETCASIKSVRRSMSSMLFPSSVGISLSVQLRVTSCAKIATLQSGLNFACTWWQSIAHKIHLCHLPSHPACTSRIADIIRRLLALESTAGTSQKPHTVSMGTICAPVEATEQARSTNDVVFILGSQQQQAA